MKERNNTIFIVKMKIGNNCSRYLVDMAGTLSSSINDSMFFYEYPAADQVTDWIENTYEDLGVTATSTIEEVEIKKLRMVDSGLVHIEP